MIEIAKGLSYLTGIFAIILIAVGVLKAFSRRREGAYSEALIWIRLILISIIFLAFMNLRFPEFSIFNLIF